jgi:hypothetical protein
MILLANVFLRGVYDTTARAFALSVSSDRFHEMVQLDIGRRVYL